VLGAALVPLQADLGAGIDGQELDLESGADAERLIPAPRPIDPGMGIRQVRTRLAARARLQELQGEDEEKQPRDAVADPNSGTRPGGASVMLVN